MSTSPSRPTSVGQQVIVPYITRPLLGRIVETEPRPTFADPEQTVLTVEVEDLGETISALAKDAEEAAP